jgi:hypothetical protein
MRNVTKKILGAAAIVAMMSAPAFAVPVDRLTVKNASDAVVFKVDDTGAVNAATVSSTGNISSTGFLGLGDAAASPGTVVNARGSSVFGSQLLMERVVTDANGGAGFIAYHNNVDAVLPGALPGAADRLGYFLFGSWYYDGLGGKFSKNGGGIAARAEAAWSSSSVPTYFTFETAPVGATSRTERMRISANGNIVTGNSAGTAAGPLSLTANDGFLYIPSTAGLLTSCATVTNYNGHVPIWYDTTNNKICTCVSGARKCAPTSFN